MLDRLRERVLALDTAALDRPRDDGGWSVRQTLEHLAVVAEGMLAVVNKLLDRAAGDAAGPFAVDAAARFRDYRGRRIKTRALFEPVQNLEPSISLDRLEAVARTLEALAPRVAAVDPVCELPPLGSWGRSRFRSGWHSWGCTKSGTCTRWADSSPAHVARTPAMRDSRRVFPPAAKGRAQSRLMPVRWGAAGSAGRSGTPSESPQPDWTAAMCGGHLVQLRFVLGVRCSPFSCPKLCRRRPAGRRKCCVRTRPSIAPRKADETGWLQRDAARRSPMRISGDTTNRPRSYCRDASLPMHDGLHIGETEWKWYDALTAKISPVYFWPPKAMPYQTIRDRSFPLTP